MLTIDGSFGEGGGQVLRTSLAMSLVTGTPFRIVNIRAGRKRPGLMRQHLTAVHAAAEVGRAEVDGAELGSQALRFKPRSVAPGDYSFATGSAGSTTLVLQTILPALVCAAEPSSVVLEGGTHNPFAPPFEFLQLAFLPVVERMGPGIEATLRARGFYPAGGGRCTFSIAPAARLQGVDLLHRGDIGWVHATAIVSGLPRHIAERELRVVEKRLGKLPLVTQVEEVASPVGPGNVVVVVVECAQVTEVFTAFGQKGVRAEQVAEDVVNETQEYVGAGVPVGRHLADQLVVPMALARCGAFRTVAPTEHLRTNIEVLRRFVPLEIEVRAYDDGVWEVSVGP
jgi:RNA 3'-terminal phosphate cyclase (ATP)